jgi:hypothetical protein
MKFDQPDIFSTTIRTCKEAIQAGKEFADYTVFMNFVQKRACGYCNAEERVIGNESSSVVVLARTVSRSHVSECPMRCNWNKKSEVVSVLN